MNLLLDTQALILAGQDRLPKLAAREYSNVSNEVFFSLVSLWEIGIKVSLGNLKFGRKLTEYYDLLVNRQGLQPLSIEPNHIERATELPFRHKDPFDRMIIGQALCENLIVVTSDSNFDSYGCKRIWD